MPLSWASIEPQQPTAVPLGDAPMPLTDRPARSRHRRKLNAAVGVALSALSLGVVPLTGQEVAAAAQALEVVPSTSDAGAVDNDADGVAEIGSYGSRNAGLSVGEQGGDGWNLRYVAPFAIQSSTREAIEAGYRAELSFRVWRADNLDGRKLVVTALPGRQEGRADFARAGIEVHRGAPAVGRMTVDVTDALRATDSSTVTFRLATDVAPTKGDGRMTQINVATANAKPSVKPTLTLTPPGTTSAPAPTLAAPAPAPAPAPTTTTTAPKVTTTTTAPKATTTTTAPKATTTTTAPKAAGSLVWSEEFGGSSLDTRVWKPYHSTYGDGNNELACLTPGNVSVSGGSLKLTARREKLTCPNGSTRQFSSGFLGTRETGTYFPRYGRFEIRAKVPHAQGLWPAFWLRHRNGSGVAEVDVMEYFHSQVPGKTTQTLHLDGRSNVSKRTTFVESPTSSPGWHTWSVEISKVSGGVRFDFGVDGSVVHSYTDTRLVGLTPARVRGCGTSR